MKAWIRLPLDALRASNGLSKGAVMVLAAIVDECAKRHTTSGVEITRADIAAKVDLTERSVGNALEQLIRAQLIEYRRTGRGSIYSILPGAVELYPENTFKEVPPDVARRVRKQGSTQRGKRTQSEQERQEMEEYLALVNRFKGDYKPGEGEMKDGIEGQMEF